MQHMDEGLLQAWLDGPRAGLTAEERATVEAHVADCPVCAERLESLRATSDRARGLLAVVDDLDEELPPWNAVVRRAGTLGEEAETTPRTPVRPWWGRRTAWAASILVALGAGWLANEWNAEIPDVRLDPLQVRQGPGSSESVEEEVAATGDAADLRSDELDRVEVPLEESRAAGDAARSRANASPTRPERESHLVPLPAEPDPVAPRSLSTAPSRATIRGRVGSEADAPVSEVLGPSVPKGLADDRWRSVSMEEAWGHLGRVVETVRVLPVTGIHVGTFEDVPVVRVQQELDDGSPLILIQALVPVRVAPDDTGSGDTIVTVDEVFVAGWADLPLDSLRSLLRGIALN